MQKFKLKLKGGVNRSSGSHLPSPFEAIKDPRRRIQLALDELHKLNTKAEIEEAFAQGLPFSHEGFAKRIRVGTGTLRVTNCDLFKKLEDRLLFLERVAGRRLRGQAAKGTYKNRNSGLKRQIVEEAGLQKLKEENKRLQQLLANAQEEILDLTHELSMALQLPEK